MGKKNRSLQSDLHWIGVGQSKRHHDMGVYVIPVAVDRTTML